MKKILGIRKEVKNKWERRVTLTPAAVKELKEKYDIHTLFQLSERRIFDDEEYLKVGAEAREILDEASIILAVKEIPIKHILANKIYLFFSHTIKGQPYNMPLLQTLVSVFRKTRRLCRNGERIVYTWSKIEGKRYS
jgi:alpha-aminoadipic semialdehyde synthase